jgi:hypothetical protein
MMAGSNNETRNCRTNSLIGIQLARAAADEIIESVASAIAAPPIDALRLSVVADHRICFLVSTFFMHFMHIAFGKE